MALDPRALPPLEGAVAIVCRACPAAASLPHVVAAISELLDVSSKWTTSRACRSIHAPVALLRLLRRIHTREQLLATPLDPSNRDWQCTWGIQAAASSGDLDTVRFLATEFAPSNIVTEGVEVAAAGGHLHVLQWFHDEYTGQALFGMQEMWLAAENGHLEVLQWLHEHSRPSAAVAVETMTLDERLITPVDPVFRRRVPRRENFMTAAGARGHLHVVQWVASEMDKYVRQQEQPTAFEYDRMHTAINGHLDVLKWLEAANYKWLTVTELPGQVIQQVIHNGHFEVVKWLWTRQPDMFYRWMYFDGAAACGRLDMLDWMLQVGGQQEPSCSLLAPAT